MSRGSAGYAGPAGVVTIGNFDGVHLGHQALLDRARSLDRGPVVAYTFHPAPVDVLRPDKAPPRLQTLDDRLARLHARGADHVVVEAFDPSFAEQSPEQFAHGILRDRLHATAVVVGWDFRFGRQRAGDAEAIRALLDVPVEQVEPVLWQDEPVSSSRIRRCVRAGSMEEAAAMLQSPHELVGTVVHGEAMGRQLGFPTANLDVRTPALPATGIYAVTATSVAGEHRGVANLGVRPHFDGDDYRVEVHLFDFQGDLYGTELRARLHHRIRDERAFASLDELVAQIAADAAKARELLS